MSKGEKMSKSDGQLHPGRQDDRTATAPTCCGSMSPAWTTPTTSASASAGSRRCRRPIARSATRFATCSGNLEDYQRFDPAAVDLAELHEIDRWALGQLNKVVRDVRAAYERFEFYRVYQRIYQFCAVELSSFYLDVLKDRLYAEAPAGPDRRAAQFVLARLHDHLTRLLAPIIPHTAEESWDYRPGRAGQAARASIWPSSPSPTRGGTTHKRDARWDELLELREQVSDRARRPEKEQERSAAPRRRGSGSPPAVPTTGLPDRELLATLCIVSEVEIVADPTAATVETVTAERSPHTPSASDAGIIGRPSAIAPSIPHSAIDVVRVVTALR